MNYLKTLASLSAAVEEERGGISDSGAAALQLNLTSTGSQGGDNSRLGTTSEQGFHSSDDGRAKTETAENLKKEEDEFAKLESIFVSELGITGDGSVSNIMRQNSAGKLKYK